MVQICFTDMNKGGKKLCYKTTLLKTSNTIQDMHRKVNILQNRHSKNEKQTRYDSTW